MGTYSNTGYHFHTEQLGIFKRRYPSCNSSSIWTKGRCQADKEMLHYCRTLTGQERHLKVTPLKLWLPQDIIHFSNSDSDVVFALGKWKQGHWDGKVGLEFLTIKLLRWIFLATETICFPVPFFFGRNLLSYLWFSWNCYHWSSELFSSSLIIHVLFMKLWTFFCFTFDMWQSDSLTNDRDDQWGMTNSALLQTYLQALNMIHFCSSFKKTKNKKKHSLNKTPMLGCKSWR